MAVAEAPWGAKWTANLAALEFQRGEGLTAAQQGREGAESNYNYGSSENRRVEPTKLTAMRNQANAQGLAESGVLAQRTGNLQADFASKQARLGEVRKAAVQRANDVEQKAQTRFSIDYGREVLNEEANARQYALENPPAETPAGVTAAGGGPPGSRVTVGPGSPQQPIRAGFGGNYGGTTPVGGFQALNRVPKPGPFVVKVGGKPRNPFKRR